MSVVATCCWCGARLKQARILRADVWACPTDECFRRCWQHSIRYQKRSDKAKDGLGVERLFWLPLPKQAEAMEAVYRGVPRILFGGARGGGKSRFVRMLHYTQAMKHANFHSLILRRKYPELEQTHIMAVRREVPLLGGTYKETTRIAEWPNGSITRFGHCQTDDDAENYLSAEYDLISPDELVTFPFTMMMRIISSLRSAGREDYTPQVVAATNPGGPEAWWVKSQYIDREMDPEEYPDYDPQDYCFIPSKLEDNPYLDKEYEKTLLALPPMLRKAYRDGSWDVWPGQYFPEWDRSVHVVDRAGWSPRGSRTYCGIDWGYIRPGCCLWLAIEPEGHAYIFDEYTFKQTIVSDVAKEIKRRSKEWGVKPVYVADTQMWGGQDQTGEDMRETFARMGVGLVQANKDRINGWQRVRAWLGPSPDGGRPWMQVHPRCAYLIRTLPAQQQDEHNPEIIDSDGDDHACLVGSTLVRCDGGDKKIRDVQVGDWVMTRVGWRMVRDARPTCSDVKCIRVKTNLGQVVEGTPDHRILDNNGGWVRLDALRTGDIIPVWNYTHQPNDLPTERLGESGSRSPDSSRPDTTSTTETEIHSITTSPTLSACQGQVTSVCTAWVDAPVTYTFRTLWQRLASGIKTLPLWIDELRLEFSRGWDGNPLLTDAPYVGSRMKPTSQPEASSAAERVGQCRGDTEAQTTKRENAASAENTSSATGLATRSHVPANAVAVVTAISSAGRRNVYNLTISGQHEYLLANGVLSKNCDALRYAVMARPAPGQTSATKRFPTGSLGWLLSREASKPRGILSRRT